MKSKLKTTSKKIKKINLRAILFGMVFVLPFSLTPLLKTEAKGFEKTILLRNTYTNILLGEYKALFYNRITNDDISSNADIHYDKLDLEDSIESGDIKDGEIDIDKLDDEVIDLINTSSEISTDSITTAEIANGTITGSDLANNISVTTTGTFTAPSFVGNLVGNVTGDLTGNADTVTNGVYTTGSYADPSWITSLDGSKITGSLSATTFVGDLTGDVTGDVTGNLTGNVTGDLTGNVTGDLTGNVTGDVTGNLTGDVTGNVTGDLTGNADTVTNGVYTTGSYADPSWITSLDGSKITGVVAGSVADGSVTNVKLASDAVTTDKILDGTITNDDLANDISITTTGTFTAPSFVGDLTGNVTGNLTGDVTGDLTGNADTVTNGVYTTGSYADPSWITSLDGSKITGTVAASLADGSVTNAKLAADAVTTDKIQDNTITGDDLANDIAISTSSTITASSFSGDVTGNITGDITGNVTGDVTGNLTGDVTGNVFGDLTGNVTGDLTGNADTVTNGVYTTGSYADPSWITSLDGSKITGTLAASLAADSVSSAEIADGTITGSDLANDITILTSSTITASSFSGDVTGDVTGNINGDLTGNVTGDLTGNVTGDVIGNVTGDLTGNADTVTNGVYTTGSYANPAWITALDGSKITGTLAASLAADSVSSAEIADGTIASGDLAGDIDITTTGDVSTNQLTATTITDGTATITGGDFSTTSHTQTFSAGNDATDSDVYITNTGTGKANLHVEGDITGNSLGSSGSRWSTIYADTINFLTGLTNADNTAGPDSTINLGTAGADSAEIHIGNGNANVSITDGNWSIADNGEADFSAIGANTPGTGEFTTLDSSGAADLNSLNVTSTITSGGALTVSTGGIDVTGASNFRNDIDMNSNSLTNVGDITSPAGTITGDFDATGSMDMNNHDINNVDNIDASGTISGTINASGGYNSNITVKGSDGNDCTINIDDGIVTGTNCP